MWRTSIPYGHICVGSDNRVSRCFVRRLSRCVSFTLALFHSSWTSDAAKFRIFTDQHRIHSLSPNQLTSLNDLVTLSCEIVRLTNYLTVIQTLRSGERTILVTEALQPRQQSSNRLPLWSTTAEERVIVPLRN